MKTNQSVLVRLSILTLAAGTVLAATAATTESNQSKAFPAKDGGTLVMDVDRGSITIETSDRSDVVIDVQRKVTHVSTARAQEVFAQHEVTFGQNGARVEVHAKFKKEPGRWFNRGGQNLHVEYRVQTPRRFNLELRTAGGDIVSSDIEGSIKAKTAGGSLRFATVKGTLDGQTAGGDIQLTSASGPVSVKTAGGSIHLGALGADATAETAGGSIAIESTQGKLKATTSGGDINIGDLGGPAEAQTAAGSIHVKTAQGALIAKTSGGDIRIDDAQDTVSAQTAAGSVKVSFSAQPHDDCRLSTSGGEIEIKLAENLGFDVEAETSGGEVTTAIPVATTVVGKHDNKLKGKINGGGKALVLKTSAGDVRISKR